VVEDGINSWQEKISFTGSDTTAYDKSATPLSAMPYYFIGKWHTNNGNVESRGVIQKEDLYFSICRIAILRLGGSWIADKTHCYCIASFNSKIPLQNENFGL
jgi:hypothetical protein